MNNKNVTFIVHFLAEPRQSQLAELLTSQKALWSLLKSHLTQEREAQAKDQTACAAQPSPEATAYAGLAALAT
jgi:hypothetical protein